MNPYIPLNDYTPDGEPHVFDDRVYIYTSHDKERGNTFCMLDYVVYSASVNDLNHWGCQGIAYSVKQDPFYKENSNITMYAPDCVKGNDGRYYLYYCLSGFQGSTGYSYPISVAVSNYPDRDFEFYGYVKNKDGSLFGEKYVNFDPGVINDNGIIRLYFGAYYSWKLMHFPDFLIKYINKKVFRNANIISGAFNVVLDDDMLTITSDIYKTITEKQEITEFRKHPFFEASSIRKINDTYYFIYSSWYNHELCYATSKDPTTGFKYQGVLISNGDVEIDETRNKTAKCQLGNNHGSFECINGQYYIFYHRHTHATSYSRQACVEKLEMDENGLFKKTKMSSLGFEEYLADEGSYSAVICCELTNGKTPLIVNGESKKKFPFIYSDENGRFIHNITKNTSIGFKTFKFTKDRDIELVVRGKEKGSIEIFANDTLVNTISLDMNSNDYQVISSTIKANGLVDLYFNYKGTGSFDFKEFTLK